MSNDAWADRVMEHYNEHKQRTGTNGYTYTNRANVTSEIILQYCLQQKDKTSDRKIKSKPMRELELSLIHI